LSYIFNVKKCWSEWAISEDWNIYGTLNFSVQYKPPFAEAHRRWALFWNVVDRHCYGKSTGPQQRMQRFVYAHTGSNSDNPHIHFLAKVDGDVRELCIVLNALWASMKHVGGAIADQNEILPVFNIQQVSEYLMHEDHGYEMNGFCEKLTHLPKDASVMRQNAEAQLRSAANRFQHLSDAAIAFGKHLERAERRYIRRNPN
jgi:hypothetical protein